MNNDVNCILQSMKNAQVSAIFYNVCFVAKREYGFGKNRLIRFASAEPTLNLAQISQKKILCDKNLCKLEMLHLF